MLRVEYHDEVLRRLAEELSYAPKGWDPTVIRSYRKKVQIIAAARQKAPRGPWATTAETMKALREGEDD